MAVNIIVKLFYHILLVVSASSASPASDASPMPAAATAVITATTSPLMMKVHQSPVRCYKDLLIFKNIFSHLYTLHNDKLADICHYCLATVGFHLFFIYFIVGKHSLHQVALNKITAWLLFC